MIQFSARGAYLPLVPQGRAFIRERANLESAKIDYEKEYDYVVRARSFVPAFEQGERNSKYFPNVENRNKKKSCIRKLIRANGEETTVPDTIMNEIHSFYSELYDEKSGIQLN